MLTSLQKSQRTLSVLRPYWLWIVLAGVLLVMVDWLFLEYALNYDSMADGDVSDYWKDSLNWRKPYNAFHMPGYAFTIALLRGATGSLLTPTTMMLAITVTAFATATASVYQLAGRGQASQKTALGILAASLFVLWPMVGTTYVAYPIADMFGMAPLFVAVWLLLKKQSLAGGLVLGLTLISHKAMWPFAILIMVAHIITLRTGSSLISAGIMLVPISVIWALGAQHHDSAFWLLSSNLDFEFQSTSSLPVFDGILGSMLHGGLSGVVKGIMVAGAGLSAIAVIIQSWKSPADDDRKWYSLAIGVAVLALVVLLNERKIWATIRFSRLLALPLVWYFGAMALETFGTARIAKFGAAAMLLSLIASQFAFSYYMARVRVYDSL